MNQILKDAIYTNGTDEQAEFIADMGGLTPAEKEVFLLWHEGESDVYIQITLGLSRKAYDKIADQVRRKTYGAVMQCIDFRMNHK